MMTQRVERVSRTNRLSMNYLSTPEKQDDSYKKRKESPVFNKLLHTAMKSKKNIPYGVDISDQTNR